MPPRPLSPRVSQYGPEYIRYERRLTAFGWLASQGFPPLAQDQGRET